MIDTTDKKWPPPWQAIVDERVALVFGRAMNCAVPPSVIGELRREICPTHPLYGVECRPIAYDAKVKKEFLFETDHPDMSFVVVHFTWAVESDPKWPFFFKFATIAEFVTWVAHNK